MPKPPATSVSKYAAFLRGINVGGNNPVPMAALKKLFEQLGFGGVKTLLASGNVAFEAVEQNEAKLRDTITGALEKKFGFKIGLILRSVAHLEQLIASNPFKSIDVTPDTRLYVTFLSGEGTRAGQLKVPYEAVGKNFKILKATGTEVFSVAWLGKGAQTVEAMAVIEKEWGRTVTTRNWNTVNKLLAQKE